MYINLCYLYLLYTTDNVSTSLLLGGLLSKREHDLVPTHRIMSRNEVNEVLAALGVTLGNLPKILVNDPQAKKAQAKAGDVLEIDREDFGKGYKYYRYVVDR